MPTARRIPIGRFAFREGAPFRMALIADLLMFTITLQVFVGLPILISQDNTFILQRLLLLSLGFPVMIGMLGRLFVRPPIPGNEWSYLGFAVYMMLVSGTFFTITWGSEEVPFTIKVVITLLMLTGLMSAFGAHVIDGGTRPNAPALSRRFGRG